MTERRANMAGPKPLTNDEGEVRELTSDDFARAILFSALPDDLKELLRSPERIVVPDAEPKKKRTAARPGQNPRLRSEIGHSGNWSA